MTKAELRKKANDVLINRSLEKRFIFVQNDKNSFITVDGKSVTEISIDMEQGIIWLGDSCIIPYKKIGYKTDEQALQFYGELLDAWILAVTN